MSHSPWKKAPSSITRRGETSVPCARPPASSSMRWRPVTWPLTLPRIDTTPPSISASTLPVSDNTLIVGETGSVEADIDCGVVSIRGSVSGNVTGRQRIELLAGGRVQGSLISPRLVIEEGAFFQGECDMGASAPAAAPGPPQRLLR